MADKDTDFEKERTLNQQILAGLGAKEQELQDITNPQRPLRAAALAALSGQNPFTAANQAMAQRTDVAPSQIAHALFSRAEEAGMPLRAPGQEEFPLEKPAGAVIGQLTDPQTLQGLASGTTRPMKQASRYKTISSALEGGKTVAADIPRNKIVDTMREMKLDIPEVVQQRQGYGLEDVNVPKTGQERLENIARKREAMKKAKELPSAAPLTWSDLARIAK